MRHTASRQGAAASVSPANLRARDQTIPESAGTECVSPFPKSALDLPARMKADLLKVVCHPGRPASCWLPQADFF